MTAEGDFHNLAGARGNNALLGCHSETAAERRVRKGQAKRGINESNVGKLQLYNQAESQDMITCLHLLYRRPAKCMAQLNDHIIFFIRQISLKSNSK